LLGAPPIKHEREANHSNPPGIHRAAPFESIIMAAFAVMRFASLGPLFATLTHNSNGDATRMPRPSLAPPTSSGSLSLGHAHRPAGFTNRGVEVTRRCHWKLHVHVIGALRAV